MKALNPQTRLLAGTLPKRSHGRAILPALLNEGELRKESPPSSRGARGDRTCRTFLCLVLLLTLASCNKKEEATPPEIPAYAKIDYTATEANAARSALAFTDITEDAGIAFKHVTGARGAKWMPETMGSGGGFLDYDNDGNLDLFLVNSSEWDAPKGPGAGSSLALYRNKGGGTFEDVTTAAGLNHTIYGMGASFADFDGDGDADIYVTAVGNNLLLRNDNGTFAEIAATAGVLGNDPTPGAIPAWSTGAAWVDVNRDGYLDLFVTNYVKWSPETDIYTTLDGRSKSYATPQQYKGETCRLYLNRGDGTFEDATEKSGVYNPNGKSLGIALADFNDDGWPDLAVANDTEPNFLYLNKGDGTFEDVGLTSGIAFDEGGRARAGMGIDVADLNNDGRYSIAIGNFAREPVSLFTQIDSQFFQDMAGKARLTRPTLLSLTFGLVFDDFDLDGFQDLVIANGHIEPEINVTQRDVTFEQRPQIFLNDQRGGFIDSTDQAGLAFAEPIVGRGIATGDIDEDGDLDLLFTVNGDRPRLLRNEFDTNQTHWVRIRLKGAGANTSAIGARLIAHAGPLVQRRFVKTGSSYLSQSDIAVTFGLGPNTAIEKLEIRWPVGRTDEYTNLKAGWTYVIDEANRTVEERT